MERKRGTESTARKITKRDEIIADLRTRASELRKEGNMNDPELLILQKALSLERKVLGSKEKPPVYDDGFSTGYAGRKGLIWHYDRINGWEGKLYNIESGILKNEAKGESAEKMLRQLLPGRK